MKLGRTLGFLFLLLTQLCLLSQAFAAVTVAVHPARAPLTLTEPQQFKATVANTTNQSVIWAVDGIVGGNSTVGTISTSGLYHPPGKRGTHKITAKSVVQSTAVGSATVWVTDYPGMFTYHADKFRSGVNLQEFALTSATVKSSTFGKLFTRSVDGQIYAQPLYVANLTIAGAKHNVVFVATEHASVYAFDADGRSTSPFWHRSFINPSAGINTIAKPANALISPEISISSTPVIDTSTGTMYVSVSTNENGNIVHRLHALSLTTGGEKFGGPIAIQGSVPGTYPALAVNGRLPFVPKQHLQRPALLLLNGNVYIAYGSNGDKLPYNGWLFAYSAQGTGLLHQVAVFCTSPDQGAAAIWQSGDGPAADPNGNIYVATGNGAFDLNTGGRDAGNTVLKLALQSGALVRLDYFAPSNTAQLTADDLDLGAGGPILPSAQSGAAAPSLVVVGGKDGKIYLVNRDNMGKFNSTTNSNVETVAIGNPEPTNGLFAAPAALGSAIYFGEVNEPLGKFVFANGLLSSAPAAQTSTVFLYPGTSPMISTNGSSSIVWTLDLHAYVGGTPDGGINTPGPAVLHAYDGANLNELYNSTQAGTRDTAGNALKFTSPTVANGHVYVGTAKQLNVYGLLP
ncbi:MAG TPA: pyrrolo-quinoline quinone [Candidatus Angelobacter sp.]|nr:pyrrolo-quinoline quinone [Candidatus Angelobacter sp.]